MCGPSSWTLIVGPCVSDSQRDSGISQFQEYCESLHLGLNVWRLGTDFQVLEQIWLAAELIQGGFLVRPDQHILMRVTGYTTGGEMVAALNRHLGRRDDVEHTLV